MRRPRRPLRPDDRLRRRRSILGVEQVEGRLLMATFVVKNTLDLNGNSNVAANESLRQAIRAANSAAGPDEIRFEIEGSGTQTIPLDAALDGITGPVFINGLSQAIFNPAAPIIAIAPKDGVTGNGLTITLGAGNSKIEGLHISGFDGAGILVSGTGNAILANSISGNDGDGVRVQSGTGNVILTNEITGNGGLGINLGTDGVTPNDEGDTDPGPNNQQNFPVLTRVSTPAAGMASFQGTLAGVAGTTYRIEFFASAEADPTGFGEGQTFLGVYNTTAADNVNGTVSFTSLPFPTPPDQAFFTATATVIGAQDTSEFSRALIAVTNTDDDGPGSLRQAIAGANAQSGADTIVFAIPGSDPLVISTDTALPTIIGPVVIDGLSQLGVVLDGGNRAFDGLTITAGDSRVQGLTISNFGRRSPVGARRWVDCTG